MISFERINIKNTTYKQSDLGGEINVFQTLEWLDFVAEIQKAEPVVAAIKSDGRFLGYFTGLITRKFGLRILGSPFRGWLTYFMGFNLLPGAPKRDILQSLPKFVFNDLRCHYLEVIDPNIIPEDWEGLSYNVENLHYYGINLINSEEEIFAAMASTGRNCIRKSLKNGVVIEEASDTGFADEYYAQYEDVFKKQGLSPAYSLNDVKNLIENTILSGNLLLIRARNSEGECIATGIFLALNKTAVFWGAASWRQYQPLRPNEPIAWYGMKIMKARGIQVLHLGGKCEQYKKKLGATELQIYRLMKPKYKLLGAFLYPFMSLKNEEYRNWVLKRLNHR